MSVCRCESNMNLKVDPLMVCTTFDAMLMGSIYDAMIKKCYTKTI
jgi:hypothetical protein